MTKMMKSLNYRFWAQNINFDREIDFNTYHIPNKGEIVAHDGSDSGQDFDCRRFSDDPSVHRIEGRQGQVVGALSL